MLREAREQLREKGIPYSRTMSSIHVASFLSNRVYSLGWRWKYIAPIIQTKREAEEVVLALTSRVRDLKNLRDPDQQKRINRFLDKNKIIITLTTSPIRLPKIVAVLATLDLTYVSHINVVLPKFYGGNREQYGPIPAALADFPKVRIIRIDVDFGPVTKMLPTIMYAKEHDPNSLIISVDDDVAYPMGMVNEFIYQKAIKHPNSVLMLGEPLPIFSHVTDMRKYWPQMRQKRPMADIVEGWASVLYSPQLVNTSCILRLAVLSKKCMLSDDFVISYALAQRAVKRVAIDNQYVGAPYPYLYGTGEDALHAGRGLGEGKKKYVPNDDLINFEKYSACLENIVEYVKLVKQGGEPDVCNFRRRSPLRKVKRI